MRSRACASASCRAPSASTRRSTRRSSASPCERLGLEPAPTSTQILQRDRHAELLAALALVGSSLERFAVEIRHLARTEVREVEEPFGHGQKGSSAMPHKRNPIVSERICGLARVLRGECAGRARERRALARARHLPLVGGARRRCRTRSSRSTTRSTASHGSSTGSSCARAACARTRLEPRAVLQPAAAARPRRERPLAGRRIPARAAPRDARVGGGARLPELVRADAEVSARVDLDERLRPRRVHVHVDTIFDRLRSLAATRDAVHA